MGRMNIREILETVTMLQDLLDDAQDRVDDLEGYVANIKDSRNPAARETSELEQYEHEITHYKLMIDVYGTLLEEVNVQLKNKYMREIDESVSKMLH